MSTALSLKLRLSPDANKKPQERGALAAVWFEPDRRAGLREGRAIQMRPSVANDGARRVHELEGGARALLRGRDRTIEAHALVAVGHEGLRTVRVRAAGVRHQRAALDHEVLAQAPSQRARLLADRIELRITRPQAAAQLEK